MIRHAIEPEKLSRIDRERAAGLAALTNEFKSRVCFVSGEGVINAKSMLGLMSLAGRSVLGIVLECEGEDETAAANAVVCFLHP